ncbi:RHS repeat-associated core domain-containing protein [Luteibacter sp. PPL201]|uniref:RHS repeat-associated core domain-containing protein n=1 Tax=Luteibacter sahnii TaxID=3021977 RepID=A0ABT6BDU8_9GAMM|nr:RHS repeat-associated core domain-containing protein [Luteibacter sp. PPL193]MDY1548873.1 RHS repeat-associated core domain-containing protein [Luteibacter sp. PPL193]
MRRTARREPRQLSAALLILALLIASMGMARAAETVTYYYTSPQGTVLVATDGAGNVVRSADYRSYGSQALGPSEDGPGYTGHVNDTASGLVYMQARYYDPDVGRFLTADPVAPKPGDIYNFNRQAYANNNPVTRMDPDGRVTCDDHSCTLEATTIAGRGLEYIYVGTVVAARLIQNALTDSAPNSQQSQNHNDGQIHVAPTLPTGLIGDSPRATGKSGGTAVGTSLPSDKFADTVKALTGGTLTTPDSKGRSIAPNGVSVRTGGKDGPRIDVPANDSKPPEIIHFPEDTQIPDELKPTP